jgi:serine/threonine-protein kinase
VYFSIVQPWDRAFRQQEAERTTTQQLQAWVGGAVSLALLAGAVLLVRRNLRLGRGDRKGAQRLAAWTIATSMGKWLFQASHVASGEELGLFVRGTSNALFAGGLVWVIYIALEPFVRRRWPQSLVSWSRLLAGRFHDPLVGRHLLYGAALGVGMELLQQLGNLAPTFFGDAAAQPGGTDLDNLLGTRWVIGEMFSSMQNVIATPMTFLFLLVLFRVLLRNSWLALAAFTALFVFLGMPDSEHAVIWAVTYGITWAAVGFFMIRFGLVSFMAAFFFASELLGGQPFTLDFSTWYAGSTLTAMATGVAVLLFAFRTSLGERKLLPAGA